MSGHGHACSLYFYINVSNSLHCGPPALHDLQDQLEALFNPPDPALDTRLLFLHVNQVLPDTIQSDLFSLGV